MADRASAAGKANEEVAEKTEAASAAGETNEEAAEKAEATPSPSGAKLALLLSIAMPLLMGAMAFVLAYFLIPAREAALLKASSAVANPAAPVQNEPVQRTPEQLAAEGGKQVTSFTIEEVTVNIADTRGTRFVRTGVYFDASGPVLEELEANRARITDILGQVLSTKTLEELTSPNIRGDLRQELLGIINPTLKQGRIDNIYFTDLLVQ